LVVRRKAMTDQSRIEPLEVRTYRNPLNRVIDEARMLFARVSTALRMALETMIRFGVRPPVTIFERQPGQFPDIGLVHRELSWLPERDGEERPPAEPFAIQARRPFPRRALRQFQAARHRED
jgi:hypothetical protein